MLPPPTVDPETMKSLNKTNSKVNSCFWHGLDNFKSLLRDTLSPKRSFNDREFVTGEGRLPFFLTVALDIYHE